MTQRRKILAIFGTRPEVIKMGPVVEALRADGAFTVVTLATAQHREMLDDMLRVFGIVPDHDLDIMTPDQRVVDVTAQCLLGIDAVLRQEKPDLSAYADPEVVWRLEKSNHAGLIVRSSSQARVDDLLTSYAARFQRDLVAALPAATTPFD